ncbi:MAG: helix-turn-helix domain-containing protein [Planctomycetota bacterium]|nr:helix-turn-helix domain-containing protein [Planctomycetota bacterium]
MKEDAFKELCQAVREGGRILRGVQKPSRVFEITAGEIKETRARLGLTQPEFSHLIGVPTSTLQNWEQGRTVPDGPARSLLKVAAKEPKVFLRVLHGSARPRRKRLAERRKALAERTHA